MVQPWTPTWSSSVTESGCHHCPSSRMALRHLHGPWSLLTTWLFMVTGALDISIDPRCSRATDPNMTFSCSSGPDVTMTLCSNASHSDLDASWSLDTNLDSGYWSDPGHPHGAWQQQEPHMSIQTLAAVRPWTLTWRFDPWWQHSLPISVWPLLWCGPQFNQVAVSGPDPGPLYWPYWQPGPQTSTETLTVAGT